MMLRTPTLDDIDAARGRIAGWAVRTPLLAAPALAERIGRAAYVKPECLQRTGSFKFRGAWNAVQALGEAAGGGPGDGVVACSSGNHAQGVAEAARLAGITAVIVMPDDAPALKIARTRRSGARVVLYDRTGEDRDAIAAEIAAREGFAVVHPYNDPQVIAGQGTVGLEIAEDCAALGVVPDVVAAPCSGGGLAAGTALAVTARFRDAQVFTAEPAGFDDYRRSLELGSPQRNARLGGSVCDALMAPEPGAIGWAMNRERLAGGLVADDREALAAVGFAFDELRLVVEPGGAVALAAVLAGRAPEGEGAVIVVLSGGNVADDVLAAGLSAYRGS